MRVLKISDTIIKLVGGVKNKRGLKALFVGKNSVVKSKYLIREKRAMRPFRPTSIHQ
jgi:hypothetical protein